MRTLTASKAIETIELINGINPPETVKIRNDGRDEFRLPFVDIFGIAPRYCYVYRRISETSLFDYVGIEKISHV